MTNCDFVEGDAYELTTLVHRPVDLIFMANAFHRVPDQPRLAQLARKTQNGNLSKDDRRRHNDVRLCQSPDCAWLWRRNDDLGYDASGARVLQTDTSTTTIYPFKWYSIASSTGSGAKCATTTEYIFNGDTLVSTIDRQFASGVATGSAQTSYIHSDPLGSTKVVTNASGNLVQTLDYPYGATRVSVSTNTNEKRKWIGRFAEAAGMPGDYASHFAMSSAFGRPPA
jgi:hypothetical protein